MNSNLTKVALILSLATVLGACNDDDEPTPNRSPVAMSVDLITQADVELVDSASASDADGDMLTYSVATEPMMGTLSLETDGSFSYLPNATFTGMDSFQFSVTDGVTNTSTGTVNITVEAQVVSFANYSRAAFAQQPTDEPLPTNGRDFTQDVEDPDAYADFLANP